MFRSSGFLADSNLAGENGISFDVASLPPFLRTLLVADGTVTKSLESWFWEPVSIELISQQPLKLPEPVFGLDAEVDSNVLLREVKLLGDHSHTMFAFARSWLSLDALPVQLADDLKLGRIGIGEILREQGVETYREIVALEYLPLQSLAAPLRELLSCDVISRSYRIRVNQLSAILVTELFPLDAYQ